MTFTIKKAIEMNDADVVGNVFDLEPYDYIFNNRNCFMDGQMTRSDPSRLKTVISELEKMDVDYLQQLFFVGDRSKDDEFDNDTSDQGTYTALKIALNAGNYYCIEAILQAMTKIK